MKNPLIVKNDLKTMTEAAQASGLKYSSIRRYIDCGWVPSPDRQVGRRWYYTPEKLAEVLAFAGKDADAR